MITLQSTSFQFGGMVFTTDDPVLIDSIRQLSVTIRLIAIEILAVLWSVKVAAGSVDALCKRLLIWMDAVEAIVDSLLSAGPRMVYAVMPAGYGPG